LDPLVEAAQSQRARELLFAQLGWNAGTALNQTLTDLVNLHGQIAYFVEHPPTTFAELDDALESVQQVTTVVQGLRTVLRNLGVEPELLGALIDRLLGYLTLTYLYKRSPLFYRLGELLAVIGTADPDAEPLSLKQDADGWPILMPTYRPEMRWSQFAALLRDPVAALRAEYLATDETLTHAERVRHLSDKLFPRLAALLRALNVKATYGPQPGLPTFGTVGDEMVGGLLLAEWAPPIGEEGLAVRVALSLVPVGEMQMALLVLPFGEAQVSTQISGWEIAIDLGAEAPPFAFGPEGLTLLDGAGPAVAGSITFTKLRDEEAGGALLIGAANGSHLEVGTLKVTLSFDLNLEHPSFGFLFEVDEAAFVLAASDGDGFLKQILPAEGLRAPFALSLGWSNDRGFHLGGSAGLEVLVPSELDLFGLLKLQGIHLGLKGDLQSGAIEALTGLNATLKLGPIEATVERVGLAADLTFPKDGGNLGPANLDLHFLPPKGVGLKIDAQVVGGGGYLFFDKERGQYAGLLELKIGEQLRVNAIGLLTTKLEDGKDGFALLVIITADGFVPIQLGFGFTLTGIGGLLGLNRTASITALRSGLLSGGLASVLAPVDPIKNAPRILSDLASFFPPARGQFLFGPLVTIGWGTPTIVTMNVALLLELPKPTRLLLLAQIKALIGSQEAEKALVKLQMNALGVIDFDKGTAALDASLYDSRLAGFILTGDMALRAGWGNDSTFLLSVGGFHPRFVAPTDFPKLRRLAIALSESDSLRLRLEAYMALTANTAQFGARLDLFFAVGSLSLAGMLGFDALVQFAPFHFEADMAGMLALKWNSEPLMAIALELALSGPGPIEARGKATVKLLCFSQTVSFHASVGGSKRQALPAAVPVRDQIIAALQDQRNWRAVLPAGDGLVSLRPLDAGNVLLAHPLGALSVRQQVAPLGRKLEQVGAAPISGPNEIKIESLRLNGTAIDRFTLVTDPFAPAQYFYLRDEERLTAPAFQPMDSGVAISPTEASSGAAVAATSDYLTFIVDDGPAPLPALKVAIATQGDEVHVLTAGPDPLDLFVPVPRRGKARFTRPTTVA
ncbi:MAG TPA: DUF6603 domain-containing protein, partial [Symbiobacteriaceae bacterium]|nr:DUF6603 domain-containing protein [Symbiobacteriaceae bacterium]